MYPNEIPSAFDTSGSLQLLGAVAATSAGARGALRVGVSRGDQLTARFQQPLLSLVKKKVKKTARRVVSVPSLLQIRLIGSWLIAALAD